VYGNSRFGRLYCNCDKIISRNLQKIAITLNRILHITHVVRRLPDLGQVCIFPLLFAQTLVALQLIRRVSWILGIEGLFSYYRTSGLFVLLPYPRFVLCCFDELYWCHQYRRPIQDARVCSSWALPNAFRFTLELTIRDLKSEWSIGNIKRRRRRTDDYPQHTDYGWSVSYLTLLQITRIKIQQSAKHPRRKMYYS
jgi:hypothetical protein